MLVFGCCILVYITSSMNSWREFWGGCVKYSMVWGSGGNDWSVLMVVGVGVGVGVRGVGVVQGDSL